MFRRVGEWFSVRPRPQFSPQHEGENAVNRALDCYSFVEVLRLNAAPSPSSSENGDEGANSTSTVGVSLGAAEQDDMNLLESGHAGPLTLTDNQVQQAFVRVGSEVHPFRAQVRDAPLALQWVATAFVKLRDETARRREGFNRLALPLRDQPCLMLNDEALRLFSETVEDMQNRLSLYDLDRGGIGRETSDALLNAMHFLYLRPHWRDRPGSSDRTLVDSVLSGALMANWFLSKFAQFFSRQAQRQNTEWACSTTVAAVGAIALNGALRITQMLSDDGGANTSSGAGSFEPMVRCPLCRILCPVQRSIKNVCAGDGVPTCCVCTERKADVCMTCGHVCLCGACFAMLPRTTAAAM